MIAIHLLDLYEGVQGYAGNKGAEDVLREPLTLTRKQVLTGFSAGVGTGAVMSSTGIWTMLNALGSPFVEKTQFYIGVGLLMTSPTLKRFRTFSRFR
jgi:hypothetical protein